MVFCCQSTLPEIPTKGSTPSTVTVRKSKFGSESTFHQNDTVAGPVTVVSRLLLWLSAMGPLCAALTPSSLICVSAVHLASPLVDHGRSGASSAAPRPFGGGGGGGGAFTLNTAWLVVTVPAEL